MISDYPPTAAGLLGLTDSLDLEGALESAADIVKMIIKLARLNINSLGEEDNSVLAIKRNIGHIEKWVFNDTYFPLFEKWIGWTKETAENEVWPGNKQARTLADKLELISKGLTQTLNLVTGKINPLPIREAFKNRLEYERKKKREMLGIVKGRNHCAKAIYSKDLFLKNQSRTGVTLIQFL